MKYKGPFATLAAGLAVAAVLLVMSISASSEKTPASLPAPAGSTSDDAGAAEDTGGAGEIQPTATTPAAKPPAAKPKRPPVKDATYAGRVADGRTTVAIAVKDEQAVAYLCDGIRTEAWLKGSAADGQLNLTGKNNARLTGKYGTGGAAGTVTTAGLRSNFTAPVVRAPSGLYRANANVTNARVVGGWIVLPDGTQVGVLEVDDQPRQAPRLDVTNRSADIDGTAVSAFPVDGTMGADW